MEKCLLVVFVLIEIIRCEQLCRADYTIFNQTTLEWPSNKTLTISNPPCLDEKGKLVLRRCQNGTWSNFTCHTLPTLCQRGLIQLEDYCLSISQTQHSPCLNQTQTNYTKLHSLDDLWLFFKKINNTLIYNSTEIHLDTYSRTHHCLMLSQNRTNCRSFKHHLCVYKIKNFTNPSIRTLKQSNNKINLKLKETNGTLYLKIYNPENLRKFLLRHKESSEEDDDDKEDGNDDSKEDEDDDSKEDENDDEDDDSKEEGKEENEDEEEDDEDNAITCFTNAHKKKLKVKLKLEEVFNTLKKSSSSQPINLLVYKMKPLGYPGEYWCVAEDANKTKFKSNVLIYHGKLKGNEFALRVSVNVDANVLRKVRTVYKYLKEIKFKDLFEGFKLKVRLMQVLQEKKELILHLSTKRKGNLVEEFKKLRTILQKNLPEAMRLVSFRNSEFCTPESNGDLEWELTELEATFAPKKLCLDSHNLPIIRKCLGNFLEGAYWSNLSTEHCNEQAVVNEVTEKLYEIVTCKFPGDVSKAIKNLTTNSNTLTPLDYYFVASTLYNVSSKYEDKSVVYDLIETIDHILEGNHDALKDSQTFLNATDTILNSIDNCLQGYLLNQLQQDFLYRRPKFLVYITKPFVSNVSGIAVYLNDSERFDENKVVKMKLNQTFDDLKIENLDLSVYVPIELLNSLIEDGADKDNLTVITTVFYNDKLFNSVDKNNSTTFGRVISVTIPNHGIYLKEPIPLIFRNKEVMGRTECAYWDYGAHSPNKTGRWSFNGGSYLGLKRGLFSQCAYTHLTHFALLIMSQKFIKEEEDVPVSEDIRGDVDEHDLVLRIITIVGCALSLIGITGIFLTAFLFKKWRMKAGTKILLQLSITILFEIVLVNFADLPNQTWGCNAVGICLHYVVLSKFSWMFVSAILQYVRFVKVFAVLPPRIVLKAMFCGWCIPLVPVVLVLGFSPDNYNLGAQKFCYPTGMGLYLGLFAPVVVIVGANVIVFTVVMKNVLGSRVEGREQCKGIHKLQLYLGILLFFMLGIPWIFGILAEWLDDAFFQLIFVYLFCLTATLQGSILFIFYVVLDKETRNLWGAYLNK